MKIGVYFTPYKEQSGVYRYAVAILETLKKIKGNKYVIFTTSPDIPEEFRKDKNFKIVEMGGSSRRSFLKFRDKLSYLINFLTPGLMNYLYRKKLFGILTSIYKYSEKNFTLQIDSQKLDLIFYPTSSNLSFLAQTPSVVTVHDLQHRLNPRFKEVSAGGRWEYREYGFVEIAKKAFRVFVDSQVGKEDMVNFYPESDGKVEILKYLPPSYINPKVSKEEIIKVQKKYNLPEKFIFYPAKFWPHKNHKNIFKAISFLKKKGKKINLVLTGSKEADFSSFDSLMRLAEKENISDQVFYLGHVDNEEFSALYKLADVLVMPTYFGPTNIPVLEAWKMGTPVIYSDIRGCREQLGNAGLLVNPDKPKEIADAIMKIYTQPKIAKKVVALGRRRLNNWTEKDFLITIKKVLKDYEKESKKGNRNNNS